MDKSCKHPRVRIVAREDDVQYLECLECSEVFDSEELRDITLEETPGSITSDEEE